MPAYLLLSRPVLRSLVITIVYYRLLSSTFVRSLRTSPYRHLEQGFVRPSGSSPHASVMVVSFGATLLIPNFSEGQ